MKMIVFFALLLTCNMLYSQITCKFKCGTYYNISKEEIWSHTVSWCEFVSDSTALHLSSDSTFVITKYHFYSDCPTKLHRCDTTWGTYIQLDNKLILTSDKSDIEYKQSVGFTSCLLFIDSVFYIIDRNTISLPFSENQNIVFKLYSGNG